MIRLALSIGLFIGLTLSLLMLTSSTQSSQEPPIRVYCAAGVVQPATQVIEAFQKLDRSVVIELARIGGSGELAGQIRLEHETNNHNGADIFITADETFIDDHSNSEIYAESYAVANQRPVIAVANPSAWKLARLADLTEQPHLKFGIAAEQAAIGKLVRDIARRDGILQQLESLKATESENVMVLAQALVAGSLDAAVVWDATVAQINAAEQDAGHPTLRIAAFADSTNQFYGRVKVGVVQKPAGTTPAARNLAQFLANSEAAQIAFERAGFGSAESIESHPRSSSHRRVDRQQHDRHP